MAQIIEVFPEPIYVTDEYPLVQEEVNVVKDFSFHTNIDNFTSDSTSVLKHKGLKKLNDFCQKNLEVFFKEIYAPSKDINIYITNSWFNVTQQKQSHHNHKHPNSVISGVFYFAADQEHDRIIFNNRTQDHYHLCEEQNNKFNSLSVDFIAKTSRLILFKSSLFHHVNIKPHSGDRISLAFNSFVYGKLGKDSLKTGLDLPKPNLSI